MPLTQRQARDQIGGYPVFVSTDDSQDREWLVAHGLPTPTLLPDKTLVLKARGTDDKFFAVFEHRCNQLTAANQCGLFGSPDRPRLCLEWPTHSFELKLMSQAGQAACGYSFHTPTA